MDHQRTSFYGMRQQVLEGRDVDQVIWGMIGDAIKDAVDKYITQDYVAANVAEWARTNFDVTIDADDLRACAASRTSRSSSRTRPAPRPRRNIAATLGEFMGEDPEDPHDWDTKGLSSWAMSRFHVNLPQTQIRKMDADEVEEQLREAALEQIDKRDVRRAREVPRAALRRERAGELGEGQVRRSRSSPRRCSPTTGRAQRRARPADEIVELIESRAREAYAPREIEYPVDHMLTFVVRRRRHGSIDNPYAADYVRAVGAGEVRRRAAARPHPRPRRVRKLRDELIGYQEQCARATAGSTTRSTAIVQANGDAATTLAEARSTRASACRLDRRRPRRRHAAGQERGAGRRPRRRRQPSRRATCWSTAAAAVPAARS